MILLWSIFFWHCCFLPPGICIEMGSNPSFSWCSRAIEIRTALIIRREPSVSGSRLKRRSSGVSAL